MKQRKRWMAVLTVWTIALLFAAGFTSQASVSGSEMIQEKNSKYTTGAGTIAAAMESIPAEAVELTKAEAQKAQEAREQAEAEAKYLGEVLERENLVDGESGEYGLFITTVDEETADDSKQQWWCITKGGEQVNTSADQTPVSDGDAFELTLKEGY